MSLAENPIHPVDRPCGNLPAGRLMPLLWALALLLALLLPGLAKAAPAAGPLGALQGTLAGGSASNQDRRNAIQAQLDAAASATKEADALAQELDRLRARARTPVPALPAPLSDEQLGGLFERWKERIPSNASQEVLERLLADERDAIAALKVGIEKSAADQANLVSQPGPGRLDLSILQQRAQENAEPVTAEPGEATDLTQARQTRRSAEHRRALLELALRQEEQSTIEARQRLLAAQLQAQRRELLERMPRAAWLTQRIAERSRQQLEQQVQEMELAAQHASTADPAIRDLAQRNAALAAQILKNSNELAQERKTLANDEYVRDQLSATLRDTQARLRLGGGSAAVGQWLWQQRVELSSGSTLQARHRAVQRQLAELRLTLFNSSKWRQNPGADTAAQPPADAADAGSAAAPEPAASPAIPGNAANASISAQQTALLARQVALTDQLQPVLLRRIAVLEQTDEALRAALRSGNELRQVLDKELLWFPSHRPMDRTWLSEWQALEQDIEGSSSPWKTARALAASIWNDPWAFGAVGLIVALLLGLRRYALRQLQSIAVRVGDFMRDHFGLSLLALGWSLLYTLPWSFAAAALGSLLQGPETVGTALEPLGATLVQLSDFIFVATLLNALFCPGGLALAHFGWPAGRVQMLRQMVRRAAWLIVPAELLGGLAFYSHDNHAISTWGRISILMLSLGLAWMAWLYFRRVMQQKRPGLHWGQIVSVVLMLMLSALAVGIVLGYVYTATEFIQALMASFVFLGAVEVVVNLLRRWLLLGERRLALNRLREAARLAQSGAGVDTGKAPTDEATQMALVTVGAQAHRLLGLLQQVLVVLTLVYAWLPVLPALLRSEGVVLWYTTNTGADGIAHAAPVSLMDALLGVMILLLTFSFARNLPGLLEVTLSASNRISSSARYTLATLARYAITIAGTVSAFTLLGLRWGQLQWMVAALTVGLGFGLQEIFANFVSGLILLVERPFRVGDVITIDTLTGTVTRIRTRATTVLDFDNKEIVIPNKTFITGQVTNWTLSDDVTRLVIDVPVAHGNDPAQVRDMLLGIAREHPQVLREPEPNCWFMALEGNGQRFELRAYVGKVEDRLPVRHDLNRRINDRLKAAGIAVAFPQLDLHVRNLPAQAAGNPAQQTPPQPAA
ncbi:mechanosensitive ion channel domain-containing protein [Delftia acidovorans]|uniref:mechanosensitive ion channel domain-containing protein n=1 Tax=Delftia acidovorans TaxID=80866 RepID=UPI003015DF6B